ncbi:MAG: hypothetical protein AAGF97_06655 [Planctomycetota bacterium]
MRTVFAATLVSVFAASTLQAAEWGNLKGTLQFDGAAPSAARLTVNKDTEVCGKEDLYDESMVVGENNGLANAVIYLYLGRGDTVDVHPDYESTATSLVEMDNKTCRFEPHVAAMRTSQTLLIKNSDPVGHNTKVDSANQGINPIIPANESVEFQFKDAERRPLPVSCSIHPWMKGWLVVKDDPYFAVTAADGSFEIKNLPVGEWEFQMWHEKAGYLKSVETAMGKASKKGRVKVEIKAGDNDLGEVAVPAALFD